MSTRNLLQFTPKEELIIYLIREDLKSRRFFDGLRSIGLDDAWYQPDLATPILLNAGFDTESDQDNDFYFNLTDQYADLVDQNNDRLSKMALEIYFQLKEKKLASRSNVG